MPLSEKQKVSTTRAQAEAGDPVAANTMGVWYEKGRHGLPKDPKQAVHWYTRSANAGYGLALHNLGDCYRDGVGVDADEGMAYQYYFKAASAGLPLGYEDMGDSLLHSRVTNELLQVDHADVKTRRELAAVWYRKAAEQGRASAQNKLKRLGQRLAMPRAAAPLPACPTVDLPGSQQISGTWLQVSTPSRADAYGFLIQTSAGRQVDVIMGNGAYPEFVEVAKGDMVVLSFTSQRGLDELTAQCVYTHFYIPGSGKITKKMHR